MSAAAAGAYLLLGLGLHLACWIAALARSLLWRREWPDVQVEPKRKSDGGPAAPNGTGHECYDYDTARWTAYAAFKLAFALVTGLLPVRVMAFVSCFCLAITTGTIGARFSPGSLPHRLASRLFALWCKGLCTSCACYVSDVRGLEQLAWVGQPGQHPIIVANHVTMLEAFHLHWLTGGMSGVMAKAQLANPGFKALTKFLNVVIADHKDKDVKDKVTQGIASFAENRPSDRGEYPFSQAFTIYPEGTTNSQKGLFRFNTGAFAPGKPVLPCVQRFPYAHMNPAWVSRSKVSEGNDVPLVVLRCMTQFDVPLQVKFLDVYRPTEAEKIDPTLYANNVQNYMAMQLGCCATDTPNKVLRETGGPFDVGRAKQG